jgi:quercetin dioxygenase-like cupin family protein
MGIEPEHGSRRRLTASTARHLYVAAAALISVVALVVALTADNGGRATTSASAREGRFVDRAAENGDAIAIIPLAEGHLDVANIDAQLPNGTKIKISMDKPTHTDIVKVVLLPHSTLKWHSHVSPFISTLVSGELWDYDADQPACGPVKVAAGTTILEPSNWVHALVNRSDKPAVLYGMSWTPSGANALTERPVPHGCPKTPR